MKTKTKTKNAQIGILVITLLLTAFPLRAQDLAAPVPAPADFWVRDQAGRIKHACGGKTLMTGLGPAGKTYALTFSNVKK